MLPQEACRHTTVLQNVDHQLVWGKNPTSSPALPQGPGLSVLLSPAGVCSGGPLASSVVGVRRDVPWLGRAGDALGPHAREGAQGTSTGPRASDLAVEAGALLPESAHHHLAGLID